MCCVNSLTSIFFAMGPLPIWMFLPRVRFLIDPGHQSYGFLGNYMSVSRECQEEIFSCLGKESQDGNYWTSVQPASDSTPCEASAQAHHQSPTLFRNAEALLPSVEAEGSHHA